LVLCLLCLAAVRLRPTALSEFPDAVKVLALAGVIFFGLAWAAALLTSSFLLYLPSRYTQAGLTPFALLFGLVTFPSSLKRLAAGLVAHPRSYLVLLALLVVALALLLLPGSPAPMLLAGGRTMRLALSLGTGAALVLLSISYRRLYGRSALAPAPVRPAQLSAVVKALLLLAAVLGSAAYVRLLRDPFLAVGKQQAALYAYLQSLPKDVLLFGYPCEMDNVPTFARRKILFGCDNPHPSGAVMWDGLQAYYATSRVMLRSFCSQYRVSHLVVRPETLTADFLANNKIFFEPYEQRLRQQLPAGGFVLAQLPTSSYLYEGDGVFVAPCAGEGLVEGPGGG
ncbi:MAG: hypothetical protein ACRDHL_04700, partial [Candidatus Promineifilaceae bacterium]